MIDVHMIHDNVDMDTMGERLRWARKQSKKFPSARKAGQTLYGGTSGSGYIAHENGQNDFDADQAKLYASTYGVDPGWLLTGEGDPQPLRKTRSSERSVPVVGLVNAGMEMNFVPAGELERVPAPDGATEATVAVRIRGDSLGPGFNGWLAFYDDVRDPMTRDLEHHLCVVGLESGQVMIKIIRPSSRRGYYHLLSQVGGEPILDVRIAWAARVKQLMAP